jgi:uncharacterized cupredoxin-like copper-binding protein
MKNSTVRRAVAAGTIGGAAALALILSGPSAAAPHKAAAKKATFTLTEFKIAGKPTKVAHGKITFTATNKGKFPHELAIIRTNKKAAALPKKGGKAVETGLVGRIAPFTGSKAHRKTFTLKKGHYALICNLPGHYVGGMHLDFTVS